MNGDGLPDLVQVVSATRWDVYLNTGSGFESSAIHWSVPSAAARTDPIGAIRRNETDTDGTGAITSDGTDLDLIDINADGLPDLVFVNVTLGSDGYVHRDPECSTAEYSTDCLRVGYNTGQGFESPVAVTIPSLEETHGFFRYYTPSPYSGTSLDFFDVNGDGLPDLVDTGDQRISVPAPNWRVAFNRGGHFDPPVPTEIPFQLGVHVIGGFNPDWPGTGPSPTGPLRLGTPPGSTIDLIDFNGDGMLDRVVAGGGTWAVQLNQSTTKPNLLISVQNGLGGYTDLLYGPSTSWDNTGGDGVSDLPFITWAVRVISSSDGDSGPGHVIGSLFTYQDGRFDSVSREFLGFREVDRYGPGNADTRTIFGQSQNPPTKGQVLKVDTLSYTGNFTDIGDYQLVKSEAKSWATRQHGNSTQIYLAESVESTFDLSPSDSPLMVTTVENVGVDDFGNVTQRRRQSGSDRVDTYTEYASAGAGSLVRNKPRHTWSEGTDSHGSLTRFDEKEFYYDGYDGPIANEIVSAGNLTRSVSVRSEGDNPETLLTYDLYGNVQTVTDPLQNVVQTTYDGKGLYESAVTRWPYIPLGAYLRTQRETNLYLGKPTWTADENGQKTLYGYDTFGRLISVALPGTTPLAPSLRYTYHYGSDTELSWVKEERAEPNNSSGYLPRTRYFDALGRYLYTETSSVVAGILQTITPDRVEYDAAGRLARRHNADDGITEYDYDLNGSAFDDPLGRVHQVTAPDQTVTETIYDGPRTTTLDQEGYRADSLADGLGRVLQHSFYDGTNVYATTTYTYDGAGHVATVTQNGDSSTTVYSYYDSIGRKILTADPDSGFWHYDYDLNGNLIYENDPAPNQQIQYCYDGFDRITKKYYVAGEVPVPIDCSTKSDCESGSTNVICFDYDEQANGKGRLTSVTDLAGSTTLTYDSRGHITSRTREIVTAGGVSRSAEMIYAYDLANHLSSTTYPDGEIVTTGYDEGGQPVRLTSSMLPAGYIANVTYERFGRVVTLTHGNGVVDTHEYDAAAKNSRLRRISTVGPSGSVYQDLQYSAYWPRGFLKTLDDARYPTGALSNAAHFEYDLMGRLVAVTDSPAMVANYGYDSYGRVTAKEGRTFDYSPTHPHQVTTVTRNGVAVGVSHDDNGNREGGAGGAIYTYDADDRLVDVSGQVQFYYDYSGRRVAMANSAGATTRYYGSEIETSSSADRMTKYYFIGNLRVAAQKVAAPIGTASLADEGVQFAAGRTGGPPEVVVLLRRDVSTAALVAMAVSGMLVVALPWRRRRVVGVRLRPGLILIVVTGFAVSSLPLPLVLAPLGGGCAWAGGNGGPPPTPVPTPSLVHYHVDHVGSTQVVTDADGALYENIRYSAYGEVRGRYDANGTATAATPQYEYTGYESISGTGLEYAGARFYEPAMGMFLTRDPAGASVNPYSYTDWNPINAVDPDGSLLETLLFYGAVAAFLYGAATSIQAGVESGDPLVALGGLAVLVGTTIIGAGVGGIIGAGKDIAVGTKVAAISATTGLGGYGAYQAFDSGNYGLGAFAAVMTALSLLSAATTRDNAKTKDVAPRDGTQSTDGSSGGNVTPASSSRDSPIDVPKDQWNKDLATRLGFWKPEGPRTLHYKWTETFDKPPEDIWSHWPGGTVEVHWQNQGYLQQSGRWGVLGLRGPLVSRSWGMFWGTKTAITSGLVLPSEGVRADLLYSTPLLSPYPSFMQVPEMWATPSYQAL